MAVDSLRTCVGCGRTTAPERLERFVLEPSFGLVHDLRRKAPGRGAWVHADPECLNEAVRVGFRKSFRTELPALSADDLREDVARALRVRVDETARLGIASGAAAVGETAVVRAMKANDVALLLLAANAGSATRAKHASNAERKNVPTIERFDGETIAGWSGRDFVAVMTMDGPFAARLQTDVEDLERLRFFEG